MAALVEEEEDVEGQEERRRRRRRRRGDAIKTQVKEAAERGYTKATPWLLTEPPQVDPNFFAEDYTVAAATGFQATKTDLGGSEDADKDHERNHQGRDCWQESSRAGLGAGLAGLCAAAMGAHVLLTDLKTVTDCSLRPNVVKNSSQHPHPPSACWPGAGGVGKGTAACMTLDWTKATRQQAEEAARVPPGRRAGAENPGRALTWGRQK
eukprot:746838-Hanusia_phi.AAC.1